MTKFGKRASLLLGASALAIAVAAAPSPSMAFNTMEWDWELKVEELVDKFVRIRIDLRPTGMALVQNIQVQAGDVTATSTVTNVKNNQPAPDGVNGQQQVTFNLGEMTLNSNYDGDDHLAQATFEFDESQTGFVSLSGNNPATESYATDNPNWTNGGGTINLGTVTFLVDVTAPPTGSFDAQTELPEVVSAAVAIANNSSLESNVAVQMHEGQFAFGGFCADCPTDESSFVDAGLVGVPESGNRFHDVLVALAYNASLGNISQGTVSADSTVRRILNATVDSSATAVVNNKSITIDARTNPDALLMADITQFSYMNASANSDVSKVRINNYHSLGLIDGPIVSSVATAVGNNLNIKVSGPAPAAP